MLYAIKLLYTKSKEQTNIIHYLNFCKKMQCFGISNEILFILMQIMLFILLKVTKWLPSKNLEKNKQKEIV